jgi:Skp family chaperone for outer membrane proteins
MILLTKHYPTFPSAFRLSQSLCIALSFVLCSASIFPQSIFADDSREIYVVDVRRIASESIAGKALKNSMEAEMKKSEAKLRPLQTQAMADRQSIEKQRGLLSEQAMQQKRLGLVQKEQELQRAMEAERKRVADLSQEKTKQFREQLDEVIEELADEKEIDFLVEKDAQTVLYVDARYDLTKEVLQAMNASSMNN